MIGILGELPFVCSSKKVFTFNTLARDHSARWATHEIIGKKPVLEFVGEGLSSGTLSMRFDASLGVLPKDALDRLKRMLENRQYKTLIIGEEYLGKYVIDSISEERLYHSNKGLCLVATASVKLVEWSR